jgi:hypothetical protein
MSESADELSKALRLLVKCGNLTHLSIVSNDKGFQAAYRGVDGKDHRFAEGFDVVDTILEAISGQRHKAQPLKVSSRAISAPRVPVYSFDDL